MGVRQIWSSTFFSVAFNSRFSYASSQPTSEKCGASNVGTGVVAGSPQDRICPNGHILLRNTIRKNNAFKQWDIRLSRAFPVSSGNRFEVVAEVFNVTNRLNNLNPSAPSLLFNFDGTIRSGIGDSRRFQLGARWEF